MRGGRLVRGRLVGEGKLVRESRAIMGFAVKASSGSCHQGAWFLKQVKGASASLRVQILFMAIVTGRAVMGARGSRSVDASRAGQFWIHSVMPDLGSLHAL